MLENNYLLVFILYKISYLDLIAQQFQVVFEYIPNFIVCLRTWEQL